MKQCAVTYSRSRVMANVFALIVLIDFLCTCYDVDSRAAGEEPQEIVPGIRTRRDCLEVLQRENKSLI